MATFDETQTTDLAVILGTSSLVLADHLTLYQNLITDADKAKILEYVTAWRGVENDFVSFTPTESNEGFNLNTGTSRGSYASKIAALLQWDFSNSSSGQGGLIRC